MTNTDIAVQDTRSGIKLYSSLVGTDQATLRKTLSATLNSDAISDNLNTPIQVVDVVIQPTEMTNEATGELQLVPRVILIDAKGKAYHAISMPLYRDITNAIGLLGEPSTWGEPLPVIVKQGGSGTSKYFKMSIG